MNKKSAFFLAILALMVALGAYESLFALPAITIFIRYFALIGFGLLCITLMIGPLSLYRPEAFNQLIKPRRALGIAAFLFIALHFILYFGSQGSWDLELTIDSIPLGGLMMASMGILLVLAITSSDYAIKQLGFANWKNIQRASYLVFVLSFIHFVQKANGLFVQTPSGKTFLNIGEALMIVLGVMTIALQIAGYFERKRRIGNAAALAAKDAEVKKVEEKERAETE